MSRTSNIDHKKWYMKSYLPALTKRLEAGDISKHIFDKLNDPYKHLLDKRYKK